MQPTQAHQQALFLPFQTGPPPAHGLPYHRHTGGRSMGTAPVGATRVVAQAIAIGLVSIVRIVGHGFTSQAGSAPTRAPTRGAPTGADHGRCVNYHAAAPLAPNTTQAV